MNGAYLPYFNISDDNQFKIFSDKVLAPNKLVDTVRYAQFNYNLQTANKLDFLSVSK